MRGREKVKEARRKVVWVRRGERRRKGKEDSEGTREQVRGIEGITV